MMAITVENVSKTFKNCFTSVSSEWLFSDARNLINTKRTNLDTKLVGQLLFLKKNLNMMQVFAPEWDEDETIEID